MAKAKTRQADQGELIKYEQQDMPQLEVWLDGDTVWLTQKQMAELFGCAVANVNMHLEHIYAEGELQESPTIKDFLIVRIEGKSAQPSFGEFRDREQLELSVT